VTDIIEGYDASTPPWPVPSAFKVTGGYIGGATPHVWTADEWKLKALGKRLPIYVPTFFNSGILTAGSDAVACVNDLKALSVPKGVLVGLDFETLVSGQYVSTFDNILVEAGYKVLLYGSTSTVFKNPKSSGGYWAATRPDNPDFSGYTNLYPGSVATQIKDIGAYDIDLFDASLVFWGDSVPIPPVINDWTVTVISNLPTVKQGDTGTFVDTVQGLLCARGYTVKIDGQFGPITDSEVRRFQRDYNVPNSVVNGNGDGQVGQHTWTTLITNAA
jgi:peptidoglycan hydrolase-like protein with peptidoglycan-binding domain